MWQNWMHLIPSVLHDSMSTASALKFDFLCEAEALRAKWALETSEVMTPPSSTRSNAPSVWGGRGLGDFPGSQGEVTKRLM
jgi:hypothetical protein